MITGTTVGIGRDADGRHNTIEGEARETTCAVPGLRVMPLADCARSLKTRYSSQFCGCICALICLAPGNAKICLTCGHFAIFKCVCMFYTVMPSSARGDVLMYLPVAARLATEIGFAGAW